MLQKKAKASLKESSIRLGYWNVDGFGVQSAWAVQKILETEVI